MTAEALEEWPSTTPEQVVKHASKLLEQGYVVTHTQLGPMDSGLFLFTRGRREVRVLADRGQWWIEDEFGSVGPFPSRR